MAFPSSSILDPPLIPGPIKRIRKFCGKRLILYAYNIEANGASYKNAKQAPF